MTNTQGTCDGGLRKSFEVYSCFPTEYEWGPFPRGVPGQTLLAGNSRAPGALAASYGVPVGQAEHKPHSHLSWQRLQQMIPLLLVQAQEALDWVFDSWMLYFGLILIHSLAGSIQLSKALQDPKRDPGCSGAPTGLETDFLQALFENSPVISTQLIQSWVTCPDSVMQNCGLCFPWFLYSLHETEPEHRRR